MGRRTKIGDVVEFEASGGFIYAHYSHKHDRFGSLLRVFKGIYPNKPNHIEGIVDAEPQFLVFFPLAHAVNRGFVSIVGNFHLPENAKNFRNGTADPVTKKVSSWWLWDGEKEWRVGDLTAAERKLPMLHLVNDTTLIERVKNGYLPQNDGF